MRATIDSSIERDTSKVDSWEGKGIQCGAEFDSKITDVVYSGRNDCGFSI